MWEVFEKKAAFKNINHLPKNILERYEFWKSVAEVSGPDGIKTFSGFRDHPLKGEWKGYRSASLREAYRVIYRLERTEIRIYVIDVNHHDDRRK